MGKWARNILIGAIILGIIGMATAGTGYVWYKYDEYRLPERITFDWDNRVGEFVEVYHDKEGNLLFHALDKILKRRTDIEAYPQPIIGGEGIIYLNQPVMQEEAKSFITHWKAIEANSKLNEGDPNWRPDYQLAWEILKYVPEEQRYRVAYDQIKKACIDHEKEHLDFYWGTINSLDMPNSYQEMLAISRSASENLMELEHAENLARYAVTKPLKARTSNDIASMAVTALILSEMGNISKYDAYHQEALGGNVKAAAGKVYANAKKSAGLSYS